MNFSWFVQRNGEEEGPIPAAQIADMAMNGNILPHDYVRRSDMNKWIPAGKVKGLQFRSTTPALPLGETAADLLEILSTSDGREIEILSNGTWRYRNFNTQLAPTSNRSSTPITKSETRPQFRKVSWGATEREVRDSESADPVHEFPGALVYNSRVAGLTCDTFYIFVDNQLVRAKYAFSERHSNDNQYINDYFALKNLLTDKYGLPLTRSDRQEDQIWLNDLYQDDPDDWGTAVAAGHLVFLAEWQQEGTKIGLVLRGDNYEVQLQAEYIGVEYEELEDQRRQQQHLDDL